MSADSDDHDHGRIGGGTAEVQRNIIAQRVLGLPAEMRPDKTEPFRAISRNA